ncbi:MAG: NFYB/HAP3 family transcription factor subunit [Candidatus Aenigmatarchaeota archaeon]
MAKLAFSTFKQILKEASKGIRVSKNANIAFIEHMESYAKSIAKEAAELARHAGRKTITEDDIKFILKKRKE